MKITTKEVRDITAILNDIVQDYKENSSKKKGIGEHMSKG